MAYLLTIPNFLALVSSMFNYTTSMDHWLATYKAFQDATFLIAFVIVLAVFTTMTIIFIVYSNKHYTMDERLNLPLPENR